MDDIDMVDAPYGDVDALKEEVEDGEKGGRDKDDKVEKETCDDDDNFEEP